MRFEYQPGHTFLHRMDVRAKLLGFTAVLVMTFLFGQWIPNLGLAVIAAALMLWAGARPGDLLKILGPLTLIAVIVAAFAAYAYVPTESTPPEFARVVASLPDGSLPLTVGGISYGVSLALRILTMVMLTTLLLITTPIEHFVAAMRQARVPHFIVFIVMTALRFIPTMQHRAEQVLDAQRARGARIDQGGMIRRIQAYIPIMVPLITSGIRMSDDLAAAMVNRGYGATRRPTALFTLQAAPRDYVATVTILAAVSAAIWLRTLGWWSL